MTAILATSSSGAAALLANHSQPANLDAQKANCERQLADWVHCVSASTPRGKEKIDELQSKLKEINSDIQARDAVSSPSNRVTQVQNGKSQSIAGSEVTLNQSIDASQSATTTGNPYSASDVASSHSAPGSLIDAVA